MGVVNQTGRTFPIVNQAGLKPFTAYAANSGMDAIRSVTVLNPSATTSVKIFLGSNSDGNPITIPPNFTQTIPIQASASVTIVFVNPTSDGSTILIHVDALQLTASGFQGAINIGNVNVVNTPLVNIFTPPATPIEIYSTDGTIGGTSKNIYTVPVGKTLYITDISLTGWETCAAASATLMGASLRRSSNNSILANTVTVVQNAVNNTQGYHYFHSYKTPPQLLTGDTLEWVTTSNGASSVVADEAIVHGYLI